jgi:hypothetical protein
MDRGKFNSDVNQIKEYIERSSERVDVMEKKLNADCKDGCLDYQFQQAPSEIGSYNGFVTTKVKGPLSSARSDCSNLPKPYTSSGLLDLGSLMEKHDIIKQPLLLDNDENYLTYANARYFADNWKDTEGEANVGVSTLSNYYYLGREEGKLKLKKDNNTAEETYLCLEDRTSLAFHYKESKNILNGVRMDLDSTNLLLTSWSHAMLRCHQTKPNGNNGLTKYSLLGHPMVRKVRNVYYGLEETAHVKQNLDTLQAMQSVTTDIRTAITRYLQAAQECQIDECAVEVATDKILYLCRKKTMVRGKKILITPVPYTYEGNSKMLSFTNYLFDFGHQTCTSHVDNVVFYLDPVCCKQIDEGTNPNNCPSLTMSNAPMYYENGVHGHFTDAKDTLLQANCGTNVDMYQPKDNDDVLTDCALILKNRGNHLEIPGFGTMMSELERFQESTGHQFSDAEIGLISLAVVFIVFICCIIICKCPCFMDAICAVWSCCFRRAEVDPTAPTNRKHSDRIGREKMTLMATFGARDK